MSYPDDVPVPGLLAAHGLHSVRHDRRRRAAMLAVACGLLRSRLRRNESR
jgi:hypothetical protein